MPRAATCSAHSSNHVQAAVTLASRTAALEAISYLTHNSTPPHFNNLFKQHLSTALKQFSIAATNAKQQLAAVLRAPDTRLPQNAPDAKATSTGLLADLNTIVTEGVPAAAEDIDALLDSYFGVNPPAPSAPLVPNTATFATPNPCAQKQPNAIANQAIQGTGLYLATEAGPRENKAARKLTLAVSAPDLARLINDGTMCKNAMLIKPVQLAKNHNKLRNLRLHGMHTDHHGALVTIYMQQPGPLPRHYDHYMHGFSSLRQYDAMYESFASCLPSRQMHTTAHKVKTKCTKP
eukprot:scaffold299106_cov17-Tisochrysis_lutea.AAC.1